MFLAENLQCICGKLPTFLVRTLNVLHQKAGSFLRIDLMAYFISVAVHFPQ